MYFVRSKAEVTPSNRAFVHTSENPSLGFPSLWRPQKETKKHGFGWRWRIPRMLSPPARDTHQIRRRQKREIRMTAIDSPIMHGKCYFGNLPTAMQFCSYELDCAVSPLRPMVQREERIPYLQFADPYNSSPPLPLFAVVALTTSKWGFDGIRLGEIGSKFL